MTAEQIRLATLDYEPLGILSGYVCHNWPSTKAEVQKQLQPCWLFKDEIAIFDGIAMKGKRIIVPALLQDSAMKHINHMGIEKTRLLACNHIYWVNMNASIKETMRTASHALISSQHDLRIKQCHMNYLEDDGNL